MDEREFTNTTQGYTYAVKRNDEGRLLNVPVAPGGSVFLTQEEELATARAPEKAENNPFLPQKYTRYDEMSGEPIEEGVRAPLELVAEDRLTPPRPIGSAVGTFARGEEVGTPAD